MQQQFFNQKPLFTGDAGHRFGCIFLWLDHCVLLAFAFPSLTVLAAAGCGGETLILTSG